MREFPDRELKWTQPAPLKGSFELLCGDDRIGILRSQKSFGPARRKESRMELGAFSISLAVKELEASRAFDEKVGFSGMRMQEQADGSSTAPASVIAVDPDGNPILVDQHV